MSVKILAVDTATENCSVALKVGSKIISRCEQAPREHSKKILLMVEEVLTQANIKLTELDALAFGQGPGSFTGVRIGIGIAQGLAFGANLPMIGISTLAAMAQQAYRLHNATAVISSIDARMNEIYLGAFLRQENGNWEITVKEQVCAPEKLKLQLENEWFMAGTGWNAHPSLQNMLDLSLVKSDVLCPEAQDMLLLAEQAFYRNEMVAPEMASPVYLRNTVTWQKLPGRE